MDTATQDRVRSGMSICHAVVRNSQGSRQRSCPIIKTHQIQHDVVTHSYMAKNLNSISIRLAHGEVSICVSRCCQVTRSRNLSVLSYKNLLYNLGLFLDSLDMAEHLFMEMATEYIYGKPTIKIHIGGGHTERSITE